MIKLRKQLKDELKELYRQGEGVKRHDVKDEHNHTPFIHSSTTLKTYKQQIDNFCDYWKERGTTSWQSKEFIMRELVPPYVEHLKEGGKSAWTIYTAACAIAKALHCSTKDFDVSIPKRERNNIVRSRYEVEKDKHVSKAQNQAVINFCMCTGLRRHELEKLKTDDCKVYSDGSMKVYVKSGKGGKSRLVDVIGSEKEVTLIKNLISDKEGKIFQKVSKALDIHSYRAIYAARAYKSVARDIDQLDSSEKYVCRKDRAGEVFDKAAMHYASTQLGHNRVEVIAYSYLHTL